MSQILHNIGWLSAGLILGFITAALLSQGGSPSCPSCAAREEDRTHD